MKGEDDGGGGVKGGSEDQVGDSHGERWEGENHWKRWWDNKVREGGEGGGVGGCEKGVEWRWG